MARHAPILVFLFLAASLNVSAQLTDSWVNDRQSYFKIKNAASGAVRVTQQQLTEAGVPVGTFAPQNLQLFHKGREVPIFVAGEQQGALEYVEFMGRPNDGWLDTGLYVTPADQLNRHYSMVTDTAAYFLTWNTSYANLRYTPVAYTSDGATPQATEAWRTARYSSGGAFFRDELDPELGPAEGWFSTPVVTRGSSTSRSVRVEGMTQGGYAEVSFGVAGASNAATQSGYNHHLRVTCGSTVLCDTLARGYVGIRGAGRVPAVSQGDELVFHFASVNDQNVAADRMAVAFVEVRYPSDFRLSTGGIHQFEVEPADVARRIVFAGMAAGSAPVVYETRRHLRLEPRLVDGSWSVTLPASQDVQYLEVTIDIVTPAPGAIRRSAMTPAVPGVGYVVVSQGDLMPAAQRYAAFRGGMAVDVDGLYDRYAYGIEKHPLAVRYFLRSLAAAGPLPGHLFLVGRGVSLTAARKSAQLWARNRVPVPGVPSSDALSVIRVTGAGPVAELAVGRLSADTPQEVDDYLAKVRANESRPATVGGKTALHFGGGGNAQEQTLFANYLREYERIFIDTLIGGRVSTFLKNSSAPIVTTQSDSVRRMVDAGPALLTFFGHSWAGGFDQNIEDPSAYDNAGRLPLIIANSCSSGNIFDVSEMTTSELWVKQPERGAVGFLASVDLGYPDYLHKFTRQFYQNLAYLAYGETFGTCVAMVSRQLLAEPYAHYMKSTCLEFVFHGDPAARPVFGALPDFDIASADIATDPREVTTEVDSFAVRAVVSNLGRAHAGPVSVYIERHLPDGTTQSRQSRLERAYLRDTATACFPVDRERGAGRNQVTVTVDDVLAVAELDEGNNQARATLDIASTDVIPVWPRPFAVVAADTLTLRASTGDPFAAESAYRFELSADASFASPPVAAGNVVSGGGVLEWRPGAVLTPGVPYFWRVARVAAGGASDPAWRTSSFAVSSAAEGERRGDIDIWRQSSQSQFAANEFRFMEFDSHGQLHFANTPRQLTCENIGGATGEQVNYVSYDLDGNGDYASCQAAASMVVAVIDSLTLLPWTSDRGDYGHVDYPTCPSRDRPNHYFTFRSHAAGLASMERFLRDVVRTGDYVLAYSVTTANFETWTHGQYAIFEELGSERIRTVPNSFPYIFLGQKGNPAFAQEVVGDNATATILLERVLTSNFYHGSMTTPWIGPAESWDAVRWAPGAGESEGDSLCVKIFAPSAVGGDSLVRVLQRSDTSAILSDVAADYLRLEYFTHDASDRTPTPPGRLEVSFASYPDIALNPLKGFRFHAARLDEGDSLRVGVAVTNVSRRVAPSFAVDYTLRAGGSAAGTSATVRVDSLPPFGSRVDTVVFGTRGMAGAATVEVSANYADRKSVSFPEPFAVNNIGWLPLEIAPDQTPPLLSVTFDGAQIMNNDIVSATPEIVVRLSDNNPYIPLDDTALVQVFVTYPGQAAERRVALQSEQAAGRLLWEPSRGDENVCRLRWRPVFDVDGVYRLRVSAADMTGNPSGKNDYAVHFEVVNKSTITHVLNYPNPFSTSTQFVFTLTGSALPDDLRIEVYTVGGRLVRTITRDELGPLRIGNNVTRYAWDGRDDFGDRLANGVYFYRVSARIAGKEIEHRATATDAFFKKGFGKLCIMR